MTRLRTRSLPVFPVTQGPVRPEVGSDARPVEHRPDAAGPADGPTIGLVTLGCDKNTVDSERMMAALAAGGARVVPDPEEAEVVVVNTCGFIDVAKEESVDAILDACRLKADGKVRAVAAVGCLVQRYADELAEEIPEVDLLLGLADMGRLIPELRERELLPPPETVPTMERPLRMLSNERSHSSFLKISEGCDHSCAFCAIPHMRGLHRSAPVEELVREARELEAAGVRELNIVSQDSTWYGKDLRREAVRRAGPHGEPEATPALPDLLRALLEGTSVPWYRLFYMYPSGITRELVEVVAESRRVLPYLDLPIQHGSDRILRAMRRPERQETIRERVGWLREAVPDVTLRTTVIVGFPGETEEDFRELLDLLGEVRFDRVGAFPYSVEEGTPAAEMEDRLPEDEKRRRVEILMDLQREISFEANLEQVGRRRRVLVDEPVDDDPEVMARARTTGQAADVDGVTHLLRPRGEAASEAENPASGEMLDVEIVDAVEYDLVARPL